jgi:uncharacterized repeat protein (TIGR01451 family)
MTFKTLVAAVITSAALIVPGVAAASASATPVCANPSVQVAATPTISTVGTSINYNYSFCYNTNGDHYTVQIMSETANASGGGYSAASASALTTTALAAQPGAVSGSGVFTPTATGRYEVVVAYYMQGQAAWEDEGQTVFIVNAAPVVIPTPPVVIPTPPVVIPTPVVVPTSTPTPPPVVIPTPTPVIHKAAPKPLKPVGHPTPPAKLSLVKTANVKTAAAGSDVHFTIVVGDISKTTARKVVVCDTLPANTLYVSASRAVDFHGADACFNIGNLAKGDKATTTLTLQLAKTATGVIVNHAIATAANAKSVYAQAQVTVPTAPTTFVPAPVTG